VSSSRSVLVKSAAKYVVGILLLALVIYLNWGTGGKKGLKDLNFQETQFDYLLLATVLYVGIITAQYIRWWMLVRALELPFRLRDAFRLGMVGTFYNTFLPGSIGGDFVKAYFIAKGEPQRKASAVATVVADRLLGLFGLLLFGAVVGGGFWLGDDPAINNPEKGYPLRVIIVVCAVLASVGALGYGVIALLPPSARRRFADRLAKVRRFGGTLSELWFTAVQYGQRPLVVLKGVALSAVAHTLMMLSFHYAVRVFPAADPNMVATLPEHFVILPIGFIFQALVPLPGGLGVAELSFGGLYELIGRGAAEGVAGRLSLRLIEWGLGLICYLAYLRMKAELPAEGQTDTDDTDQSRDEEDRTRTV